MHILRILFSCPGVDAESSSCVSLFSQIFLDPTAHMAILTANLGKRLSVDQASLLRHVLMHIPALSTNGSRSARSVVDFSARGDDDCNAEIFSIRDWQAVHAYTRQADGYGKSNVILPGSVQLDETELEDLTHVCSCCHGDHEGDDGKGPRRWNNIITVTAKGAVILRFSWSRPMPWTERHARMAIGASNLACRLIECCC